MSFQIPALARLTELNLTMPLQQRVGALKQNLQRIEDVADRVEGFQVEINQFCEQLEPTLKIIGVAEADWASFKPAFPRDVGPILAARTGALTTTITELQGSEPPAPGTIAKLEAEISSLLSLETADKARQERTKQIHVRLAAINTDIERLEAEIAAVDENGRTQLAELGARRLDTFVAYFANLKLEQKALQGLYDPIRERLAEQALLDGKELEFAIRWGADLSTWLERGAALFDQRRAVPYGTYDKLCAAARNILLPAFSSADTIQIRDGFEQFMAEFRREDLPWKSYVRSGVTLQDVLNWLYEVDHVALEYGLKFNGAALESLSPGAKGIVLLILYLGMDTEDSRPLVVDQPDENLDNESIYLLLTPYFRMAKVRRQLIVITHNPNLVVNSDSEQIILAEGAKRPNGLPVISYRSGSLEDNHPPHTAMRQQVCKVLEGGDVAFLKRERRYAIAVA